MQKFNFKKKKCCQFVCFLIPGESEAPIVIEHPKSTIAMVGMDVALTCIIAFSGDGPYVANWLRDAVVRYLVQLYNWKLLSLVIK